MRDTKKILENKNVCFKNIYKLDCHYFSIRVISFLLFIKNVFLTIKNSIFPPKYTKYGKSIKKENYLFEKDL